MHTDLLSHFQILFGSVGVTLGLFFATYLFAKKPHPAKASFFLGLYLLALSLRFGKSIFYNFIPISPEVRTVFMGLLLLVGPSLLFFVRIRMFGNEKYSDRQFIPHFIPALLFVGLSWIIPNDRSTLSTLIFTGLHLHILLYNGYTIYFLRSHRDDTSEDEYRWLVTLAWVTLALAIIFLSIQYRIIPFYLTGTFVYSCFIFGLALWVLYTGGFKKIEEKNKYSNSSLGENDAKRICDQIDQVMKTEQLYLDPDLSLSKLSERIKAPSKQVSQAINQIKGVNYSNYVAQLRVDEVKCRLTDAEHDHFKISAIAYDCGFNSMSSFNSTFKRLTGMTARQYRSEAK